MDKTDNIEAIYTLTPAQESLLYRTIQSRAVDDAAKKNHGQWIGRWRRESSGEIDLIALESSWRRIVDRHPVLRTFFVWQGLGKPHQVVRKSARLTVEKEQWPDLSEDNLRELKHRSFEEERIRAFDLSDAPLLRVKFYKIAEADYEIQITYHALILDGPSVRMLIDEVFEIYEAETAGRGVEWKPVAAFQDYASYFKRRNHTEAQQYWERFKDDFKASTGRVEEWMRTAGGGAVLNEENGSQAKIIVPIDAGLERLGASIGVEPGIVVAGAWALLLSRYSGRRNVITGARISGRRIGMERAWGVIGPLENTIPLLIRAPEKERIGDWLRGIQKHAREAAAYWWASGDDIKRWVEWSDESELFESSVQIEGIERIEGESGLSPQLSCLNDERPYEEGLRLSVAGAGRLRLEMEYDPGRYDRETLGRILEQLNTALASMADDPGKPMSAVRDLREDQVRKLVIEWNDTRVEYGRVGSLADIFQNRVAETPDAIALSWEDLSLTYAELNARANQLAHYLLSIGAGPEIRAGLCLDRSPEMIVGLLAIIKAGAVYVPLDPDNPRQRLAFLMDDSGIAILITSQSLSDRIPSHWSQLIRMDSDREQLSSFPVADPPSMARPDNLAYIIYTSGSTGMPKGVEVTQRAVVRLLFGGDYARLDSSRTMLGLAPLSFDASTFEVWGALLRGGRLALYPDRVPTAEGLRRIVYEQRITTAWLTSSLFNAMIDEDPETLRGVEELLVGGEALSVEHIRRAGREMNGTALINGYGPTEGTTFSCCHRIEEVEAGARNIPIGKPIANTRVYVLGRSGDLIPQGMVGELYIGGDGLARGYGGRSEITAERFAPDGVSGESGGRLYRTGDLARWSAGGELEYLGRSDDQVKIRGYRIELGEIETTLREHPIVMEAVVAAGEDLHGHKRLVAYIVPTDGNESGAESIRSYLTAKLPSFMTPSRYVFLRSLPLTSNGKVDRKSLPPPEFDFNESQETYVAPRDMTEKILAEIFSEILGVERIGARDNFFEIGGDSIRGIQLISRANERGLNFSIKQLFDALTIEKLAERISAESRETEAIAPAPPFSLLKQEDRERMPGGVKDAYPLASLQAGMIFHSEYSPETSIYHDICSFHLRSHLDEGAIRETIQALIDRHSILRASIDLTGYSEPLQLAHDRVEPPVEIDDLRGLSDEEQELAIDRFIDEEKRRPFDWSQAPLLRLHIHHRRADRFQFTLSFHHAVLDGWSLAYLLKEFFQHYLYLQGAGGSGMAPAPAAGYGEFIALEREALESEECRRYWRARIESRSVVELPRLSPGNSKHRKQRAQETKAIISAEISEGLKAAAKRADAPLKTVFMAAHLRVLNLLSGQSEIMTGFVTNGRPEGKDGDRILGLFLNTLPFHLDLTGGTWEELIRRTFAAEQEMMEFRRFPLAEIQRMHGGAPLFETAFNFVNFHIYKGALETREIEILDMRSIVETNLTLLTNFNQDLSSSEVELVLMYDSERLSDDQAGAISNYYLEALSAIARAPLERYDNLDLLSESERERVLIEWNRTGAAFAAASLKDLFEEQVRRSPHAIALADEDRQITYCELNRRANRLSRHLQALSHDPEPLIGVCMGRSIEMVEAILAALKAGGAYVPLDPAYPKERLTLMINDSGLSILVTDSRHRGSLPENDARIVDLDADGPMIARRSGRNFKKTIAPDQPAYVIYTSGSTGRPKGALGLHRGAVNRFQWMWRDFPFESGEVCCQKTSSGFVDSVWETLGPILKGARLHIIDQETLRDQDSFMAALSRHCVTRLVLVPSLLKIMLESGRRLTERLPALKVWVTSGEALPVDVCRRFLELLPKATLLNLYGSTEVSADATAQLLNMSGWDGAEVPIGRPIANTEVFLLDRYLQPAPAGVLGEIYIGGEGLARGYLNFPELTAERFIANPFGVNGERLYRTGDLGRYRPDGTVMFAGRVDNQVKSRGFRVEPSEIEAALAGHEAIRESVVVGRNDERGETQLVAYVIRRRDGISSAQLKDYLRERVPEFMVPPVFVFLESLPLTSSGKIDRRALPKPGKTVLDTGHSPAPPSSPEEEIVAEIWKETLGIDRLGVHDNFLDLGGHSLLATRIVNRIRETLRVHIPLRLLFEKPTVAGLVRGLREMRWEDQEAAIPPIEPAVRPDRIPLSFSQQRLWFIHQLNADSAAYNIPAALRLRGSLDINALGTAISGVIERHEALRTTFHAGGDSPFQLIQPSSEFNLRTVDLSGSEEEVLESRVRTWLEEEARRPFDLSKGPLFRAALARSGEGDHFLSLTFHHIVSDGWSTGLFMKELIAMYEAAPTGSAAILPPLAVQYADFAVWQRRWFTEEILGRQLEYWRQSLKDIPVALNLPLDRPRPAVQEFEGSYLAFSLPTDLAESLKTVSRKEGVTLFKTLLSAFQTLLYRYADQEDICVGTPIANRSRAEIENLIGFFVNTLVMRAGFNGNPRFADLLRAARETALMAYANQDLPFEQLVEALQPERSLNRTPLFQVMFTMQNIPMVDWRAGDLSLSLSGVPTGASKFDLTLTVTETDEAWHGLIEYRSALFDQTTIERMAAGLRTLLEAVATDTSVRVGSLPIISRSEAKQLLAAWAAPVSAPRFECVHGLFEEQVELTPDAVAIAFGDERITYSELNRRANRLARRLESFGVGLETPVGLCLERSLQLIISLLGVLKSGGAYLPLDPAYPQERLDFMLSDSQAPVLITQETRIRRFSAHSINTVCIEEEDEAIRGLDAENAERLIVPDNLAYIMYTSGSTGRPKGVAVRHGGLCNLALSQIEAFEVSSLSRVLQFASFSFDASISEILMALLSGATLWVETSEALTPGPDLMKLMREAGVTTITLPPSVLSALAVAELPELRTLISAGESCPPEVVARWSEGRLFLNAYGPTEATVCATIGKCETGDRPPAIGRQLPNVSVYTLDRNLQPAPIGVAGELYIGGAGVARGYWRRPELTAECFIPDPFSCEPGARLYRSGDLARYLPDRGFEHLGRIDLQVKIRGFRVELHEIEMVMREHPGIAEALALLDEDGMGAKRLIAYCVSRTAEAPAAIELRLYLSSRLPEYMIPASFTFIDALPLSPNGKIDRAALPAPGAEIVDDEAPLVAPRTPIERVLAAIWTDLLGVEPIGAHHNFFKLGGHSLLALKVIYRVQEALHVELSPRSLFESPTVESLAEMITDIQIQQAEEADLAASLDELDNLSDEEVRMLLAEELQST